MVTKRYFPFAKGIPYEMKNGIYIEPRLDFNNWHQAFENKKAIIICHKGFLENLFTTSVLEAVKSINPSQAVEWMVNPFFKRVWSLNGLGKESDHVIDEELLTKYPVPLFYNADDTTVYLNICNNYRIVYTFYGQKRYHNHKAATFQLFRNIMIDWNFSYLPKMRNLRLSESLKNEAVRSRFSFEKPYILLIPDVTGLSDHDDFCINWKINEIRSFAAMIRGKYNLVILSPDPRKYYGIHAFVPKFDIESLIYLLSKASVTLSREVDFAIGSMILGNSLTFSLKNYKEFQLERNKKFLTVENKVITSNALTPYFVFQELERWEK